MTSIRQRGGLILQLTNGYSFVGSEFAKSVVPAHPLLEVPGLAHPAVGLSLVDDRVVTVLSLGNFNGHDWVICHVDGDWVGLTGAKVVDSGLFPTTESKGIRWQDQEIEELDVRALHLSAEQAIWRARASRDDSRHT